LVLIGKALEERIFLRNATNESNNPIPMLIDEEGRGHKKMKKFAIKKLNIITASLQHMAKQKFATWCEQSTGE